jgi:hypothetical protein
MTSMLDKYAQRYADHYGNPAAASMAAIIAGVAPPDPPAIAAPAPAPPAASISVSANAGSIEAEASLSVAHRPDERGRDVADRVWDRRMRLFECLHQVPIGPQNILISGGTGTLDVSDTFRVKTGYMWSVRRIFALGFTAGSLLVYRNSALQGGEPLVPFYSAGVATFGPGECLLDQDDRLVFAATGITLATGFPGIQINGAADCLERWLLPDYLMGG